MENIEYSLNSIKDKLIEFTKTTFETYINTLKPIQTLSPSVSPTFFALKQTQESINTYKQKLSSLSSQLLSVQSENKYLNEEITYLKSQLSNQTSSYSLNQTLSNISSILHKLSTHLNISNECNSFFKVLSIQNSTDVYSILNLSDNRIATGGDDGSIKIYSLNLTTRKYQIDIEKNAHNYGIYTLCELIGNRLISGSYDKNIKIWQYTKDNLIHIKTLNGHSNWINKVIVITNNRIVSSSWDKTIKIWSSISPYNEINTLIENNTVYSLLQLKNKETLVSGSSQNEICFWNLNTYKKEFTVKCCGADSFNGLIELPNGLIAVNGSKAFSIDLVDPIRKKVVKQIIDSKYIYGCGNNINVPFDFSCLKLVRDEYLVYLHYGNVCWISVHDLEIVKNVKLQNEFYGYEMVVKEDKFMLLPNFNYAELGVYEMFI